MKTIDCDIAVIGGGLAGGLIALAFARLRPDLKLLLIDSGPALGGNHVWSFFASDISDAHRWLVAPLIVHGWRGYQVRFPERARTLRTPYYTTTSERLDQVVRAAMPLDRIITGVKALAVSATNAVLDNGVRVRGDAMIDARGPGDLSTLPCGWQKFLGRTLDLAEPHGLQHPIVMDATVEQIDGYRFVYCLPLSSMAVFVEDTYYSDDPALDTTIVGQRIDGYAAAQGWKIESVSREEVGVLPVVKGGGFAKYWASSGNKSAKAGVRAGLFQALTSYSLPNAVRTAIHLAGQPDVSGKALSDESRAHAASHWRAGSFYRMLSRMLFDAAEPEERYKVLQRFYGLDAALIERFYAGRSTFGDKARILSGKPPVPVARAIRSLVMRP